MRLPSVVLLSLGLAGCDAAWEPPCRASEPRLVIPLRPPSIAVLGPSQPFRIDADGAGGVFAVWHVPPASALELVSGVTIAAARISPGGAVSARAELHLAQGGYAGVAFDGSRFGALTWALTATTVALGEVPLVSIRASVFAPEDAPPPERWPEIFRWRSFPTVRIVPNDAGFLVLVMTAVGLGSGWTSVLQLDRAGAITSSVAVGPPISGTACSPRADLARERICAGPDGSLHRIAPSTATLSLAPPPGPFAVALSPDHSSLSVIYSQPGVTLNDLFYVRMSAATGEPLHGPERLSEGTPIGLEDAGDLSLAAFTSDRLYLAPIDASGAKLGGDLAFGPAYLLTTATFTRSGPRTFAGFLRDENGLSVGEVSCEE